MPIYEYQCDDCGIRFEKLYKNLSSADPSAPCPECGAASRKLVSACNHTFKHPASQTRGPLPPSTGTSDDWNADKAIGRDAAAKWQTISDRGSRKDSVLRDAAQKGVGVREGVGPSRDHLVRTQGDYRVVKDEERRVINARRQLAAEVAKTGFTNSAAEAEATTPKKLK